ncbi:uncharacterized protein EDB91DRAFT_610356 [Suillus paluster]|uniref:uncharacterized protein n=1 Tax=Suillus paluster TaxID=48578 RepID=UPI001B879061|nr:uncharacterized protein EDB91DRAFT_610356 [Suillus paluster]KAG1751504.1 hypothetical protein EDB91DRAFT_610356 [Suillus paluster]
MTSVPHSPDSLALAPHLSANQDVSPAAPSQSNPRTSSSPHSLDCHTMPQNNILSPSQSTPTRPTVPTNGVRMLNGRVYGSKRQTPTKPFASARDEPEFVEWGYGGMGSVSCSSDSRYSVLAKGAPALLSHSHSNEILVGNARGGACEGKEQWRDFFRRRR